MAPKFSFNESPKGTLNLTVEDGAKRTTWALTGRTRTPTLLDVFKGVYEALGGVPEAVPAQWPGATTAFREKYVASALKPVELHRELATGKVPSEWDGPGEDTVLEYAQDSGKAEPFPAEELLAPPEKHQMTEAESRAILEATTAMLRRRASWVDDPESINPREVNDIDAGQRPPELHPGMGAPSVRVEGRKLVQ